MSLSKTIIFKYMRNLRQRLKFVVLKNLQSTCSEWIDFFSVAKTTLQTPMSGYCCLLQSVSVKVPFSPSMSQGLNLIKYC